MRFDSYKFTLKPDTDLVNRSRYEVLDLPDLQAGRLPRVLVEELRVVQRRLLQTLVPAFGSETIFIISFVLLFTTEGMALGANKT